VGEGEREETASAAPAQGRVARLRARVRRRILEVAENLMTERGVDGVTIDDITEAADIARRSFYHHFESKHDVLVPIARARTKQLNQRIDRSLVEIDDPAEVMATGMRLGLRELTSDPLCRWFVLKSGLPQERLYEGLGESGMRDAVAGVRAGRFHVHNHEVMRPLISGAFVAVMAASIENKLREEDLDDAVEYVLRLLGVEREEAHEIAHRKLRRLAR